MSADQASRHATVSLSSKRYRQLFAGAFRSDGDAERATHPQCGVRRPKSIESTWFPAVIPRRIASAATIPPISDQHRTRRRIRRPLSTKQG
jgi:hypothetical protein